MTTVARRPLTRRQTEQEAEYTVPRHWLLRHTARVRYARVSVLFAELIERHVKRGGLVFDVGCGDGKGTFDVHHHVCGDYEIRGLDYSERAVMLARAMTHGSGLRFEVMRAEELETLSENTPPNCLMWREVIEHLTDAEVEKTLNSAGSVLPDGGIVIVSVPSTNSPVSSKHYRHYTPAALRILLKDHGFEVLELIGFGYRPRWLCKFTLWINELPKIWNVLNPLWRTVDARNAHTLVVVGRRSSEKREPVDWKR